MKRKGFTIVELLIVIVVVAILATVTIVAYNGIQNRAKNTAVANVMMHYVKGLSMYAAEHGVYPVDARSENACLDGTTVCWTFAVSPERSQALGAALKAVMGNLPQSPDSVFFWSEASGYYIVFTLADTSPCPAIGSTRVLSTDIDSIGRRRCRIGLPNPS